MRDLTKPILFLMSILSLQACGTSVQPGERGLR